MFLVGRAHIEKLLYSPNTCIDSIALLSNSSMLPVKNKTCSMKGEPHQMSNMLSTSIALELIKLSPLY
jgi:hypothetical protein